jgi:opacity protein-like surface antigen
MSKRKLAIIFLLLGVVSVSTYAQKWKLRRYEATFSLGSSNFFGDIGAATADGGKFKDLQMQFTRPSFAFGARYKLAGDMAVKMNLIYGFIAATDDGATISDAGRRNYSFSSTIFEPSFQFEYYLIPESRAKGSAALFNRRGMVNNYSKVYMYVFGGVGGVLSNPKILNINDEKVPADKKFTVVMPVGLGLKYTIDSKWSLGFEYGRRFSTGDYIDGLKPTSSQHNDIYDFAMFSAIYKIKTDRRGLPVFGRTNKFRR